ncbi:MAG: hypothetical protein R3F19_17010 [Verrucomicrobiales bacterium]
MNKSLLTLLSVATLSLPLCATADDEASSKPDRKPLLGERGHRGPRPGFSPRPDLSSMSAEERQATIKEQMQAHPRMAEMLTRRFDKDEDGELSDTELAAAAEAIAKRGGKPRGPRGEARGEGRGSGKGRGFAKGEGRVRPDRPAEDAAE